MADPGFPRGWGANPQGGGPKLLFGQKFAEKCMKMKEYEPGGGVSLPPDPPMLCMEACMETVYNKKVYSWKLKYSRRTLKINLNKEYINGFTILVSFKQ